jgi:hypothetical protein
MNPTDVHRGMLAQKKVSLSACRRPCLQHGAGDISPTLIGKDGKQSILLMRPRSNLLGRRQEGDTSLVTSRQVVTARSSLSLLNMELPVCPGTQRVCKLSGWNYLPRIESHVCIAGNLTNTPGRRKVKADANAAHNNPPDHPPNYNTEPVALSDFGFSEFIGGAFRNENVKSDTSRFSSVKNRLKTDRENGLGGGALTWVFVRSVLNTAVKRATITSLKCW